VRRGDHMYMLIFMACMCRGDHMGVQGRLHVYAIFYGVYVQGKSHGCAGEITCTCLFLWRVCAGEITWVRRNIEAYHNKAEAKGVKIVHCCGYDSVPSGV